MILKYLTFNIKFYKKNKKISDYFEEKITYDEMIVRLSGFSSD